MTQSESNASTKPLLRALKGERQAVPPIWLMRQAGRYLPEYRELRRQAGSFLDLCFTPELACEVTLQPIRRFGLDGAILFSDILVLPYALGQPVWFEEGVGPRLEPLQEASEIDRRLAPDGLHDALAPVYETLRRVKAALPAETTLLGFAGAPWTVASYMLEGGSSRDFATAKRWAYADPGGFQTLIDLLAAAIAEYLKAQIAAGAEAVQLFDSWAGSLPAPEMRQWCLAPAQAIITRVKAAYPEVPVILFPRGAGPLYTAFARDSGADALGLDTALPPEWAAAHVQSQRPVQGNLDPLYVVHGGEGMRRGVTAVLDALAGGPFVFNLGHGVVPETPPEHVAELVALIRDTSGG